MKIMIALLSFTFAFQAQARQYIQCAHADTENTDRVVINLDGENSTLFLTTGVQDPNEQRWTKSLKLISQDAQHTVYQSADDLSMETVTLPTAIINKASKNFQAELLLQGLQTNIRFDIPLLCFSSLH